MRSGDVTESGGYTWNKDLTKRIVDAGNARASRHSVDLSSWVEVGATGSPNWEESRSRRSTRPEVDATSMTCKSRPRGSVLPNKESRRPDDGEHDTWPDAVSDEVR